MIVQDKAKEVAFFDRHGAEQDYDAFTPDSNARLIDAFKRLTALSRGAKVADLGCGSGAFSVLLAEAGFEVTGIDITPSLIERARLRNPSVTFLVGDVERLPFESESLDGILLSSLTHHLPDPSQCANEVYRVLRKGGRFMAFDPNRMNPFFYLYRDPTSPFYSQVGVTENERPILAWRLAETFRKAGFFVSTDYISKLSYRYVASGKMHMILPIYNAIDRYAFAPAFMRDFRAFVLTAGEKKA